MRKISGNIKILTNENYSNRTLKFILCDKYGNKLSAFDTSGQIATEKTIQTDEQGNFSISLYETEESKIAMFYKMVFVDNEDIEDIQLFIQKGDGIIDFLKLLSPMSKLDMFYEVKNLEVIFYDRVVMLFNNFFVNENIFINNDEKNIIKAYVDYANGVRVDNEIIKKLDKYLGSL